MTDVYQATQPVGWIQTHSLYERSNLTRLQLLYWLGQNLRPESPLFNTILVFKILSEVDESAFQRAFQATIEHSDALRTVIDEIGGIPQRMVRTDFDYNMDYIDFSTEPEPEASCQAWLQKRCKNPLKLDECMFDAAIVKISSDNFIWFFNQHHILTDASSAFLVFERMAKFYELSVDGKPLLLPDLPQFEDYAEYEKYYQNSPQYKIAEAYWQKKLSPGPEPMKYFGRPPVKKTTKVHMVSYDLGQTLSQKIRSMANQNEIFVISEDLSLYNLFVTLFFIQLHQLSGNRRLGLVTPVHNRFSVDSRNTVGLVMELCPYQIEVSEHDTFISMLNKVKRETRETMTYYQYGSGLTFQSETFDVMFNTHPMPVLSLDGSQVLVERIHPGHGTESMALHVIDNKSSDSFLLNFYFHDDVFDEKQREQTIQLYVHLLEKFLEDKTSPLVDIHMFDLTTLPSVEEDPTVDGPIETSQVSPGLPQDLLEYQLIQIWEKVLDIKPIDVQDNFFDLGGNSWMALRLIVEIEQLTGQYLPLTTLLQLGTISDLARGIRQKMGKVLWSTLVTIQPGDNKQPLFCVPGAGGNGLAISRIARHLGQSQPVYMFQVPLHEEDDRASLSTIEEMAANYVEALLAHKPEGPYLLAGYSAGGLVAFEVAQQLQRKGQQVDLLAIIDVPAQSYYFKHLRDLIQWLNRILKNVPEKEINQYIRLRDILFRLNYFLRLGYRELLQQYYMEIKHRVRRILRFIQFDRWQRTESIRRKLRRGPQQDNHTPTPSWNDSRKVEDGDLAWQSQDRYMRRYFEMNSIAVKLYVPQPYPGRLVLFKSSEGYLYSEQRSPDHLLGWGRIARGGVELYEIPGNHMDIVREPNVKILGEQLKKCLDRIPLKN